MATILDYNLIIDDVIKNGDKEYELTQKKVKKICNNELPKSMFNKPYIKRGKNNLSKFLLEECEWEVIEPKIVIKWKGKEKN